MHIYTDEELAHMPQEEKDLILREALEPQGYLFTQKMVERFQKVKAEGQPLLSVVKSMSLYEVMYRMVMGVPPFLISKEEIKRRRREADLLNEIPLYLLPQEGRGRVRKKREQGFKEALETCGYFFPEEEVEQDGQEDMPFFETMYRMTVRCFPPIDWEKPKKHHVYTDKELKSLPPEGRDMILLKALETQYHFFSDVDAERFQKVQKEGRPFLPTDETLSFFEAMYKMLMRDTPYLIPREERERRRAEAERILESPHLFPLEEREQKFRDALEAYGRFFPEEDVEQNKQSRIETRRKAALKGKPAIESMPFFEAMYRMTVRSAPFIVTKEEMERRRTEAEKNSTSKENETI